MKKISKIAASLKYAALVWLVCIPFNLNAQELERPIILVKPSDRTNILAKIEKQPWAKDIYTKFIKKLNQEITKHQTNPDAFLRAMPFDWKKAKPNEIPPFHHTYHLENGKQHNLDNATDEEWIHGRELQRYLQIGVDAGMAYYLTEDEKYAQCAIDILNAFTHSVLQSNVSDWQGRGGWLFPYDGFREVREIGDKVPLIYDFTAAYLKKGGKPYDLFKKSKIDFPLEKAQQVFRTYADITINYGQTNSNHPVLEAPSLVYNALVMEDKKEREKLLDFFLTKSTENQDALPILAKNYKNEGDIWPETSQYLNHVSIILTRLMLIVNKYDPSLRLGEKYVNILFSLPVLDYLVYPNDEIIRWGDGHRKGKPEYESYEDAYLLGEMDDLEKVTNTFGPLLRRAIEEGNYKRKGMESILLHGFEVPSKMNSFELPRTEQLVHAGIFLQRNLSQTNKPEDGLMAFVGGAHMVHGHAEGMNIELYGKGQVLGVDNGRGRYQVDIHENYSRIWAAHNTVIVNGSSRGEGG
ncbi:MAG: heparinase II/III family protein, partial [Cellulophaga sp.]|nr:heparinase II/III family protein [Cellulophaga sp.]